MPCSDPLPDEAEAALMRRQSDDQAQASEILCDLMRHSHFDMERLALWWKEHRSIDEERKRLEDRGSFYFRKRERL